MRSIVTLLERALYDRIGIINHRLDPYTATRARDICHSANTPDLVPLLLEIRRGVHALDEGHDPGRLPDLDPAYVPVVGAYLSALESDTDPGAWAILWRIGDVAHRYGIGRHPPPDTARDRAHHHPTI